MAALTDLGFACEIVEALARRSESPVGGEPEDNMTEGSENAAARADGTAEVLGGVSGGLDGVLAGLGKRRIGKQRSGRSNGSGGRIGMKGRK